MSIFYKIFLAALLVLMVQLSFAQLQPLPATDTVRIIQIIHASNQRQITIDSVTVIQTLAGNASVRQGNTILNGDSIILNQLSGEAEVFGNVHINDGDTMHTYAQYLKYLGNERMAYLKTNVKLTDGKAVLTTEDLVYNLATGIATYAGGGKVINGKTVLTSRNATYYSETKEVFFKNSVHLVDPKYNMTADSLRYNTAFKTAYFISPTHIISKDGIIDTKSGMYNLETGNAVFDSRSSFKDSASSITGDRIAFEEKTGIIQIEGRGKFADSINNVIVLGDQLLIDRSNKTFLATRKPVMIFFRDNDSTYVAADTLFSGIRKYDPVSDKNVSLESMITRDSLLILQTDSSQVITTDKDSLDIPVPFKDTAGNVQPPASKDTVVIPETLRTDSVMHPSVQSDSLIKPAAVDIDKVPKDSVRYFLGFHHVKIYNDSLQAVSDSMHYSTEDSTFKLFGSPVCWNNQTQLKGDTMYVFTENQKAKRLYVFYNGIVVNRTREGFFNQMGGRTINGYFKNGDIDYIRVKGSPAESVFYPQDDDSAYVGMNRSKGDVIDLFFLNKELNKIKFINDVDGTLFPLRQIPADMKFLKNFIWEDKRRPKNKLELFE